MKTQTDKVYQINYELRQVNLKQCTVIINGYVGELTAVQCTVGNTGTVQRINFIDGHRKPNKQRNDQQRARLEMLVNALRSELQEMQQNFDTEVERQAKALAEEMYNQKSEALRSKIDALRNSNNIMKSRLSETEGELIRAQMELQDSSKRPQVSPNRYDMIALLKQHPSWWLGNDCDWPEEDSGRYPWIECRDWRVTKRDFLAWLKERHNGERLERLHKQKQREMSATR